MGQNERLSNGVKHCSLCEDMMHGKIHIKRVFMGRLIGN